MTNPNTTKAGERETPNGALELLKNQIAWLEYAPDHEFTTTEQNQIVSGCEKLTRLFTRLNHKYND